MATNDRFDRDSRIDGDEDDNVLFGRDRWDRTDYLYGYAGNDQIFGRAGTDIVQAGAGDDLVDGGSHDDQLHGGAGNDVLTGGSGNDRIDGGSGEDSAVFRDVRANYTIEWVTTEKGENLFRVTHIPTDGRISDGVDLVRAVERLVFRDEVVDTGSLEFRAALVAGQPVLDLSPDDDTSLDATTVGQYRTWTDDPIDITPDGAVLAGDFAYTKLDIIVFAREVPLRDDDRLRVSPDVDISLNGTSQGTFDFGGRTYHFETVDHGWSTERVTITDAAGGTLTATEFQALIDALQYEAASPFVSQGARTFRFSVSSDAGTNEDQGSWPESRILVDTPPKIMAQPKYSHDVAVYESEGEGVFVVTLSEAVNSTIRVDYSVAGQSGTLTFAAGVTQRNIRVDLADDTVAGEGTETYQLVLSNATGGNPPVVIEDATHTLYVIDDDFSVVENSESVGFLPKPMVNAGGVRFSLEEDPSGLFEIVRTTGEIRVRDGAVLNYEEASSHEIVVLVAVPGFGLHTVATTITVGNVNEAPTDITVAPIGSAGGDLVVDENDAGAAIGTVSATDEDAGDTVTFSVSDSRFEIVNGTLRLRDGISLDHESEPSVVIDVTATDSGGLTTVETVTVVVQNVNEAPDPGHTAFAVDEAGDEGHSSQVIGSIEATDSDGDAVFHFILSDPSGLFVLDRDTGVLSLADGAELDFETATEHQISILITDGTSNRIFDVTVNVNDVNEAPVLVTDLEDQVADEDASFSFTVPAGAFADVDAGDALTFSARLASGDPLPDWLAFDPDTATFSGVPENDDIGLIEVLVEVTDTGGKSASGTFTLDIRNTNDAPSDIDVSSLVVQENAAGATIGSVVVTDIDSDDTATVTVDDDRFDVVGDVLKLNDGISLDHEAEPVVDIVLTVTDAAGGSYTEAFVVTVEDVNEAPTQHETVFLELAENAAADGNAVIVAALPFADPDASDTLDSLTFDVSDPRFSVVVSEDASQIFLQAEADASLDFETEPTIELTVTVTDQDGLATTQSIVVSLQDVNEAPTGIELSSLTVEENADGAVIGTVTIADPDAGDAHGVTVDDARFEVVDGELKLKDGEFLDFEEEPTVALTLTATDSGGLSHTETLTVTVGPVNEAPEITWESYFDLAENSTRYETPGIVGFFAVADPDAGDGPETMTFEVSDDRFEIQYYPDTGNIVLVAKAGADLDYETEPTIDLTYTVTDQGGLSVSRDLTVTVTDANDAPEIVSISTFDTFELYPPASQQPLLAGIIQVTDQDAADTLDTLTFEVSDSRFQISIDPSGLFARLEFVPGAEVDFETEPTIDIDVMVRDDEGLFATQSATVTIVDANEAPTDIVAEFDAVLEDAALEADVALGAIDVVDQDAGQTADTFSYQVSDDRFEIRLAEDGVTPQLYLKAGTVLDIETEPTIELSIVARDPGGLATIETFTITVLDSNEAPTDIDLSATSVAENDFGAVIGAVSVVDVDASDSHSFTVSDDRFEVVDGMLKLKDGVALDYEGADGTSFDIEITAIDQGGLTVSETFTIDITDVNEAPTGVVAETGTILETVSVAENVEGVLIERIGVLDPDLPDRDSHTWRVIDPSTGETDTRFEIVTVEDGGTELRLVSGFSFNYEAGNQTSLIVEVTDEVGNSHTQSVTVNIEDVNEAPTDITKEGGGVIREDDIGIAENLAGRWLIDLEVQDPDFDNRDSHTWRVLNPGTGEVDSRFEVVDDVGPPRLMMADGISFDYETDGPTIDIVLEVTDEAGHVLTKAAVVNIYDLNEAPTDITKEGGGVIREDDIGVTENINGSELIRLEVQDPDHANRDSHTWRVLNPDDGEVDSRFEITTSLGITRLALADGFTFDYETDGPTVDIVIEVTDEGGHVLTKAAVVNIYDMNEAPTDISLSNASVDENAEGAVIGTVTVADPDAGDSHTVTVDDARFEIIDGELKLKDGTSLDHEAEPTLDLVLTATDADGLGYTETVTLTVGDVNDAPVLGSESFNAPVSAGGGFDVSLSTLLANDSDPDGDTLTVTGVGGTANGAVTVNDGVVTFFPHEGYEGTAGFTYYVSDGNGATASSFVTLNVSVVNGAPTDISLSNGSVDENIEGAVIGTVTVSDPDADDSHTVTVDDARFEVVDGELKLKAGVSLNHEAEPTVDLVLTATDSDGLAYSETVTIAVSDVNEAPPDIVLSNASVDEHAEGAVIGAVTVTDPDAGDTHTVTVVDERFEVVDGELRLAEGVSLDHEAEPTIDLVLTATDSGGLSYSETVTITVSDVNEAPIRVDLAASLPDDDDSPHVIENAAGALVGVLSAVDPDAGDTHVFTVDDGRFEVVEDEEGAAVLKLRDGEFLDYEASPTVDVVVTATDAGGLSRDQVFTIQVDDVAEGPAPTLSIDSVQLSEDRGSVVFTVTREGELATATTVDFASVDGTAVAGAGGSGDYDAVSGSLTFGSGVSAQTITVAIHDDDLVEGDEAFRVVLSNAVNGEIMDAAPPSEVFALTSSTAGSQGSPAVTVLANGTLVGVWSSSDPAIPDQDSTEVQLRLFAPDGTPLGEEFTVNETHTYLQRNPDIAALDGGGFVVVWQNVEGTFAPYQAMMRLFDENGRAMDGEVHLSNISSGPWVASIPGGGYSVRWNDSGGANVQRFSDDGVLVGPKMVIEGTLTHWLDDGGFIAVTSEYIPDVGYQLTANIHNADGTVRLRDIALQEQTGGSATSPQTGTLPDGQFVAVWATEDPDVDHGAGAIAGRIFDTATGEPVGGEFVISADNGHRDYTPKLTILADGNFAITWTSRPPDDGFNVDIHLRVFDPTGAPLSEDILLTDAADDFDINPTIEALPDGGFVVSWSADNFHDSGASGTVAQIFPPFPGTAIIVDNDVAAPSNEAPTDIVLSNASVDEHAEGAVIGAVTVTDPDAGDTHTVTVVDERFEVVDGELRLAEGVSLDHEAEPTIDLVLTATDSGGLSYSETVTITVSDVNEAPIRVDLAASLPDDDDSPHVVENAAGALVGVLSAVDPDAGDTHVFTVDDGRFEVVEDEEGAAVLKLRDGEFLDYEASPTVDVTVTATDAGGLSRDQVFTIQVDDVPENAPTLSIDSVRLSEDGGSAVYTVTREGELATATTVDFASVDGTAVAGADGSGDYDAVSGTLTFGSGVSAQTITVAIHDDDLVEGDEAFRVVLSNAVNGEIVDPAPSEVFALTSSTAGGQGNPALTVLASGTLVGVWESTDPSIPDQDQSEIQLRLFAPDGTPLGEEFTVNETHSYVQRYPDVAALDGGGFAVAWQSLEYSGAPFKTMLRLFDEDGRATGGEIELASGTHGLPHVDTLPDGGVAAHWYKSPQELHIQRFDAGGSPNGTELVIDGPWSSAAGWDIEWFEDGSFFVAGVDYDSSSELQLLGNLYNADGTLRVGDILLPEQTDNQQTRSQLETLSEGLFLAVWRTTDPDVNHGKGAVVGRVFDQSTGAPVGGEFAISAEDGHSASDVDVTVLADGNFVVTWTGGSNPDDIFDIDIHLRVFDPTGAPLSEDILLTDAANDFDIHTTIEALPDGGFVVSWSADNFHDSGANGIVAQIFPPFPGTAIIVDNDVETDAGGDGETEIFHVTLDNAGGSEGVDDLSGTGGDEFFVTGAGNDTVDGGAGFDVLVLQGNSDQYFVAGSDYAGEGSYYVLNAAEGMDHITGIEALLFSGSDDLVILADQGSVVGSGGFLRADLIHRELGADDYVVFGSREPQSYAPAGEDGADGAVADGEDTDGLTFSDLLDLGDPGAVSGGIQPGEADFLMISGPTLDDLLDTGIVQPDAS